MAITDTQVLCTFFERDFHLGAATLINSAVRHGFTGLIWLYYRGTLPAWTAQLIENPDGTHSVKGHASRIHFEPAAEGRHFGQSKPTLLLDLIDRGIATGKLYYLDPDITLRSWNFFDRWTNHGVALCQEIILGEMPSTDPLREGWLALTRATGWGEPLRLPERYFNSGFVGLSVQNRAFLERWRDAVTLANQNGVSRDQFQRGTRYNTFYTVDQDCLNIAVMYADVPLSTMGPDAMGFAPGGFLMYHAVGPQKPWRKRFLLSAIKGVPPNNGDKHFLDMSSGPIQAIPARTLKQKRLTANIATLIGRFYRTRHNLPQ